MAFDDDYQIRRFPAAAPDEPGYQQAVEWIRAVNHGFHSPKRSVEQINTSLAIRVKDGHQHTAVYQLGQPAEYSFDRERPIATFGSLVKELNIGFGKMLPTLLVTAVTVRSTHRRRGILSRMMSENLLRAKRDGLALAALTASEGGIYRRFGFGVATKERSVTVDVGPRFQLSQELPGRVEAVPRQALVELAPKIFAPWHRSQPGSIDRLEGYRYLAAGMGAWRNEEDENVLSALHYDAEGQPDGYVSYKFLGWDTQPTAVEVIDLVAATDQAYLELWQHLAAIDLIEQIRWQQAPAEDPLEWALSDRRCLSVSAEKDMLWLRILDVVQALEAREYPADGELCLEVSDPLQLTSGIFQLLVVRGKAKVSVVDHAEKPDVSLDIADLSSLYLGGVPASILCAAGRISEHRSGAVELAQRLFAVERPPFCASHF
ncbi:GNAT family N-acetyltransferase [Psychromicrobium sp. YIM B11713]|uniref:GNAT family N-acetyltransferase n=1 Tax=Psychromicrobium sp. YIM B11713 TaxID=3145233 RepID=UPI00374FCAC2